jgi:hypothetical protein
MGNLKIDWTQPIIVPRVGETFSCIRFGKDVIEKLNGIGLRTEVFYLNPEMDVDVAVGFDPTRQEERWK